MVIESVSIRVPKSIWSAFPSPVGTWIHETIPSQTVVPPAW
jgi:hypothetical protein